MSTVEYMGKCVAFGTLDKPRRAGGGHAEFRGHNRMHDAAA